MNQITLQRRAVVFVDYDFIYKAFIRYGLDSDLVNFFPCLLDHIKTTHELDVVETIVYGDFDLLPTRHQTYLRQQGLTTRHRREKTGSGLYLAVDAMVMLYDNPIIDVFVFVTGINEVIPVLSAIRYRNKLTFSITLKEYFDPTILNFSDLHEHLDDIFGFTYPGAWDPGIHRKDLTFDDVRSARRMAKLFYESRIWKKSQTTGDLVNLRGYLAALSKATNQDITQLERYFEVAHFLGYLTIYQNEKNLFIKQGDRFHKVMNQEI